MFWYMDLRVVLTPCEDVISNTLLLDGEHEIVLPKVAIAEDEVLEYDDVKYELNYVDDIFNDGKGNHIYHYTLTPVEVPIVRLVLDKYIDEFLNG